MEYLVELRKDHMDCGKATAASQTTAQLHKLNAQALSDEIRLAELQAAEADTGEQEYTPEEWAEKIAEEVAATSKNDILAYMADGCRRYGYDLQVVGGELTLVRYN